MVAGGGSGTVAGLQMETDPGLLLEAEDAFQMAAVDDTDRESLDVDWWRGKDSNESETLETEQSTSADRFPPVRSVADWTASARPLVWSSVPPLASPALCSGRHTAASAAVSSVFWSGRFPVLLGIRTGLYRRVEYRG